jgi:hypothetical protein
MIATTIINSIRVKPFWVAFMGRELLELCWDSIAAPAAVWDRKSKARARARQPIQLIDYPEVFICRADFGLTYHRHQLTTVGAVAVTK